MRTINITQEDIDLGEQNNSNDCAIALAVKRELSLAEQVDKTVAAREHYLYVPSSRNTYFIIDGNKYHLPKKAKAFVTKFDNDRATAKPFSFALRAVR